MRLLVVGLGSMGRRRARLIKGIGAAHALFGVDSAAPRRAEAEALGIACFESLEAALAAESFDAAFVCTAPLGHAAITRQLLRAGVPVFSELNLVDDGYDEAVRLAREKQLPLFLSSTMLYRAETAYIRKKVAEFAKPVNYIYHIGQYLPDWHPWEHYQNFFVGNARTSGVREILGIELPWLTASCGAARPVCVQKSSLSALRLPYADSLFATLRHAGGAVGQLAVDVVSPRAVRGLEVFGEGLHMFWEGSPSSLYEYDAETKEKRQVTLYENAVQDPRYSDNIVENAYVDELLNFFEVLRGDAAPLWSFERDKEVIALMDAIEGFVGEAGA